MVYRLALLVAFAVACPAQSAEIRRATGTIENRFSTARRRVANEIGWLNWPDVWNRRLDAAPTVCILDQALLRRTRLWPRTERCLGLRRGLGHPGPRAVLWWMQLGRLVLFLRRPSSRTSPEPGLVTLSHGVESMKGCRRTVSCQPGHRPICCNPGGPWPWSRPVSGRPGRSSCLATSAVDFSARPAIELERSTGPGRGRLGCLVTGETVEAASEVSGASALCAGRYWETCASDGMMVDVVPSQPIEDPSQSWKTRFTVGVFYAFEPPTPPPALGPALRPRTQEPVHMRLANASR